MISAMTKYRGGILKAHLGTETDKATGMFHVDQNLVISVSVQGQPSLDLQCIPGGRLSRTNAEAMKLSAVSISTFF